MDIQHTSELFPKILADINTQAYTQEQLAECSAEKLATIREREDYIQAHPPTDIFLLAIKGSLADGGCRIALTTSMMILAFPDNKPVQVVKTIDSHCATVRSIPGKENAFYFSDEDSVALIESLLSNGGKIISAPQSSGEIVLPERDSVDENVSRLPGTC